MDYDKLDETYRQEGWGRIAEAALGIRPSDVESQARTVADYAATRIVQLEKALAVAVNRIMENEPGDSRAVSDIAVALASVSCGVENPECWEIIDATASRIAELEALLDDVRKTMRNARGAIESNQIEDKDVRRQLTNGIERIDAVRKPT